MSLSLSRAQEGSRAPSAGPGVKHRTIKLATCSIYDFASPGGFRLSLSCGAGWCWPSKNFINMPTQSLRLRMVADIRKWIASSLIQPPQPPKACAQNTTVKNSDSSNREATQPCGQQPSSLISGNAKLSTGNTNFSTGSIKFCTGNMTCGGLPRRKRRH